MFGVEIAHLVAGLSFSNFIFSPSRGCDFFHSCPSLFLYLQLGITPLHYACYKGHEKIVETLMTAGVDKEVKSNVRRRGQAGYSWLRRIRRPAASDDSKVEIS